MKVILFVMLPSPSHYMAAFPIANEFQKKGFKVVFTGDCKELEQLVEENGFSYSNVYYQESYLIPNLKYLFAYFILSLLSNNLLCRRYKLFYRGVLEIKMLIKKIEPKFVFIDEHLSRYYFFFIAEKIKAFILNTKFVTSRCGNNAPLDTKYCIESSIISKFVNRLLWLRVYLRHFYGRLWCKMVFLGRDDSFFVKQFCKKRRINYAPLINKESVFNYGIKNAKTIVLAPEFLDTTIKNDNHLYICLEHEKNESLFFSKKYIDLKNLIKEQKNLKVILCSFGTMIHEYDKLIFLNKLNQAVNNENFLLIVVSKEAEAFININKNVHVLPFVPQLDILKHCHLMIQHGGLGTIKESIQFQVPMLLYPRKRNGYDWLGNAARVKYGRLGIVGNIFKDNPIQIKENIKKALLIKMPKHNYEQEHTKLQEFINQYLN